jgi:CheY-like chemotaxis protein
MAEAKRARILIVDDEESMRLLLAGMVSGTLKAEVQLAGTCEQALRLAEGATYDAVLLDLMMPGIGGLGVLYRLRRGSTNARTPVIVVSAVSGKDSIERCLKAGATAYLTKPVKSEDLAKILRKELVRTHA